MPTSYYNNEWIAKISFFYRSNTYITIIVHSYYLIQCVRKKPRTFWVTVSRFCRLSRKDLLTSTQKCSVYFRTSCVYVSVNIPLWFVKVSKSVRSTQVLVPFVSTHTLQRPVVVVTPLLLSSTIHQMFTK